MQKFQSNGWLIEFDYERTLEYYNERDDGHWEQAYTECCRPCKNFYYTINNSPKELIEFLQNLGIIPVVTANLSSVFAGEHGKQLYFISYILVGRIINKPKDSENYNSGHLEIHPSYLADGFSYHFTEKLCLPREVKLCSKPILQLDIDGCLPWVLQEIQE